MEAIRQVYQHQGLKGFYVGYTSLIMREIPFSSIQFPFYELLKLMQIKIKSKAEELPEDQVTLGGIQLGLSGSVAGAFAGFLVTPFDVLKTRLMTHDVKQKQLTMYACLRQIIAEEGLSGLYKGAMIRMGYLCVGGFAFFGIYE